MTKDEALNLALDALETSMYPQQKQLQAITAIKEALAQPEQEPVAWRGYNWGHSPDDWVYRDFDDPILDGEGNNVGQPLYTTPSQRKPLTDEMTKQMRESCDSYEMRGAFVDGWLSAEAAHGIKGEA